MPGRAEVDASLIIKIENAKLTRAEAGGIRVTPLRGAGAAPLKCLACRLKVRSTATGPNLSCPNCGHARLLRVDVLRSRISPARRLRPAAGGEEQHA
jgi:DNA-directed RNA polymerase subunit RPC12/RpoP